ncbi:MAG: hypothetical protein ACRCUP_02370 [Mycoplasmatales bacterium]
MHNKSQFTLLEHHILFLLSDTAFCTQAQIRHNTKISEKSLSEKIKLLNNKLAEFGYEIVSGNQGYTLTSIANNSYTIPQLIKLSSKIVEFTLVLSLLLDHKLNLQILYQKSTYSYSQINTFIQSFWKIDISTIKTLQSKKSALLFSECLALDITAQNKQYYLENLQFFSGLSWELIAFSDQQSERIAKAFLTHYQFEYFDVNFYRLYGLIFFYFLKRNSCEDYTVHNSYKQLFPNFVDLACLESLLLVYFDFSQSFFETFEQTNKIKYKKYNMLLENSRFTAAKNELMILDVVFNSNYIVTLNEFTQFNCGYTLACGNSFYFRELLYLEFKINKTFFWDLLFSKTLAITLHDNLANMQEVFNPELIKLPTKDFKKLMPSDIDFPVGSLFHCSLKKADNFSFNFYVNTNKSSSLLRNYLLEIHYSDIEQLYPLNLKTLFFQNQILSYDPYKILLITDVGNIYTLFITLRLKMNFPNCTTTLIPIWKFLENKEYYLTQKNLYTLSPIEDVKVFPMRDIYNNHTCVTFE